MQKEYRKIFFLLFSELGMPSVDAVILEREQLLSKLNKYNILKIGVAMKQKNPRIFDALFPQLNFAQNIVNIDSDYPIISEKKVCYWIN